MVVTKLIVSAFIALTLFYSCKNESHTKAKSKKTRPLSRSGEFFENFDTLDTRIWEYQLFSFLGNGCRMTSSQVLCEKSAVTLTVDFNDKIEDKKYLGGEISTLQKFKYGTFSVRMKNEIAPGCVSAFFLMNKWQPKNWEHKEIDIEFLGKDLTKVQFTIHHFAEEGKKHIVYAYVHKLGFDSSKEYHNYAIVWHPDSISWFVDTKFVHVEKRLLLDEEMNIRINQYTGEADPNGILEWLGPLDKDKLPSHVHYDSIFYKPL